MGPLIVVSSVFLWLIVLFNLVLTLALIRRINANAPKYLKKGQAAPNFTAETLGGEKVTLANYARRGAIFIFFSPWCGPCKEGLPKYEALAPLAAHAGVDIVLVNTADANASRGYFQETPPRLPVLLAPKEGNSFMEDYMATGTPFYCYVDAQGKVVTSGHPSDGHPDWKKLAAAWEAGAPHLKNLVTASPE